MGMHRRFFVDPANIRDGTVEITGGAARQIVKVLRLGIGDSVCVLDGLGNEYEAEISSLSKGAVSARILSGKVCAGEPNPRVTLAICLPKGDKLDLVVGRCTELGISELVVVESERTVARPDERSFASRIERWRRIATEAAEQSERGRVPEVRGVLSFDKFVSEIKHSLPVVIAWEEERDTSLKEALRDIGPCERLTFMVGPEGGFTENEVTSAKAAGAKCVSLGKRLLRSETAAIAGVAAIVYELEQ